MPTDWYSKIKKAPSGEPTELTKVDETISSGNTEDVFVSSVSYPSSPFPVCEQPGSEPEVETLPNYFQLIPREYSHFPLGIQYWFGRIADASTKQQASVSLERLKRVCKPLGERDRRTWIAAGEAIYNQVKES